MICRYSIRYTSPSQLLLVHISISSHSCVVGALSCTCRLQSNYILHLKHSYTTTWITIMGNLSGVKNAVGGTLTSHGIILGVAYSHLVMTRYLTGVMNIQPSSMSISLACAASTLIASYYYEHSYGLQ